MMRPSNFQEACRLADAGQAVEIPEAAFCLMGSPIGRNGFAPLRKIGPHTYVCGDVVQPSTTPTKPATGTTPPQTAEQRAAAAQTAKQLQTENAQLRAAVQRDQALRTTAKGFKIESPR